MLIMYSEEKHRIIMNKLKQWSWFLLLWFVGLGAALLLSSLIKYLIHL